MLFDICVDWLYVGLSMYGIFVCLFVLYLALYELPEPDPQKFIEICVKYIEENFWTSVSFIFFMGFTLGQNMCKKKAPREQ